MAAGTAAGKDNFFHYFLLCRIIFGYFI